MSTVERKEYQQTQILRTVSPVRTTRSTQNLNEFDSNLDNLLEDLQSTVSRPSSALGNSAYKETSRTVNGYDSSNSSLNRVTHLKASNPVTDYSSDDVYSYTSPDGTKHVKTYKKESYSYKTGGDSGVSQLDSLLDDLQQARQHDKESYNNFGTDSEFSDRSLKKSVQKELHYVDAPRSSSRSRAYERTFEKEGSLTRDVQYSSSEGTYGDIRTTRQTSPSPIRSNTSTLTKQTKVSNVHTYPLEVEETTTPDINPEILAQLDPHLLPSGNTKVTTTIKTYTYEIPGSNVTTTEKEAINYALNQSQSTPSKSFVYSKAESGVDSAARFKETKRGFEERTFKEYNATVEPANVDRTVVKEKVTTRNYQPGYSPELQRRTPQGKPTYVYNETTTVKNYNNKNGYPEEVPVNFQSRSAYQTKETQTNIDYPQRQPDTVVYRQETHTTNKYSPGDGYPPRDVEIINPNRPPYSGNAPKEPVNITYQYKSHSSTTNNYKGEYNDEREPLLHPRPFPRGDDEDFEVPKRVEQLMEKIGGEPPNSPYNASFNAHEAELEQQKKVETLKRQHENEVQKKEPKDLPRTKNVTGPPVYYPPGHELFAKKEEAAAWRAEGAMAREKGKYEYEASEKSKSKSRSGAAVVPVCLPLCCGLPCTII